ncbi:hypothetical protein LWI28_003351 [Acer negundo]|uniref:Uncharacterized protein n=1 Tax=Acer negundo TaxID=4023 RepID=A0AAD5NVM7_ACENE|nr:hypothetical protein LWI28_003351 [Acer negundo]
MVAMDLVLQGVNRCSENLATIFHLCNIQDLQHKPFHLTYGMYPVEDGTATFLELLDQAKRKQQSKESST